MRVRAPRIALSLVVACFSLVLWPSSVLAQTVSPQTVEFDPSADHNSSVGGADVVQGYELRFYTVGGTQPLQVIGLGKPSPQSDGVIRFNFASSLGTWPANGVVYEARVAAVGPGGSTASTTSNQFVFPGTPPPPSPPPPPPPPPPTTCSYSLSPASRSVGAGATTGSIGITVGSTCAWSAASSASWLTIASGRTGTGNGTLNYSVNANSGSAARSATLTIGSATFTVTQTGACTYAVTPTSQNFSPASGTGSVAVTVASGCSWTATRSGSWITITGGSSGSGNGTVSYRVSSYTGSSSRTGTLTVAGQPVTIRQSAATAPAAPSVPAGLRIVTVQ